MSTVYTECTKLKWEFIQQTVINRYEDSNIENEIIKVQITELTSFSLTKLYKADFIVVLDDVRCFFLSCRIKTETGRRPSEANNEDTPHGENACHFDSAVSDFFKYCNLQTYQTCDAFQRLLMGLLQHFRDFLNKLKVFLCVDFFTVLYRKCFTFEKFNSTFKGLSHAYQDHEEPFYQHL